MSKRIVLTTGMTVMIAPNSPVPWQRSVIIMLPPSLPRSFIRVSSLPLWPGGIAFSLYPTPLSLGANKAPSSSFLLGYTSNGKVYAGRMHLATDDVCAVHLITGAPLPNYTTCVPVLSVWLAPLPPPTVMVFPWVACG